MKLIAVTNDQIPMVTLIQILIKIEPYIDAVILREKSKTEAEIRLFVEKLKEAQFDIKKIIIHSNFYLASTEDVQYVQLPGKSVPLPLLTEQFPTLLFGKSVHSLSEAQIAEDEGASSVLYGHLFDTNSKFGLPARGTDELEKIISLLNIPVYAIGGIRPKHIKQLKKINLAGIAVMSSIFNSTNPVESAKAYYDAIHYKRGEIS